MQLNNFITFLKGKPYRYRLKLKNTTLHSEWSNWLIQPSESYLETANDGPVAISVIEWIDIDAVSIKQEGKLIAPKKVNDTATLVNFLKREEINFIEIENHLQITL